MLYTQEKIEIFLLLRIHIELKYSIFSSAFQLMRWGDTSFPIKQKNCIPICRLAVFLFLQFSLY